MTKHPFHIVSPSPLPFMLSKCLLLTLSGLVFTLSGSFSYLFSFGRFLSFLLIFAWCISIVREATYLGLHTISVQRGLKFGFSLFIISELFLFFSIFWAFLHSSLSPAVEIGSTWPPLGIQPVSALHLPLLNTSVLLTSCATVTWSHSSLKESHFLPCFFGLSTTILLGFLFLNLQGLEYFLSQFCISDGIFGSCFFFSTGFHGAHVFLGTLFLCTALVRLCMYHFSPTRHLGFEFAIWYWHFVDVIWLLLFVLVYIWGS